MFELKHYQAKALERLEEYLELARRIGPKWAMRDLLHRDYCEVPGLPDLPYICLRVPTGAARRSWPATQWGWRRIA